MCIYTYTYGPMDTGARVSELWTVRSGATSAAVITSGRILMTAFAVIRALNLQALSHLAGFRINAVGVLLTQDLP